jgi:hypothetical protein
MSERIVIGEVGDIVYTHLGLGYSIVE